VLGSQSACGRAGDGERGCSLLHFASEGDGEADGASDALEGDREVRERLHQGTGRDDSAHVYEIGEGGVGGGTLGLGLFDLLGLAVDFACDVGAHVDEFAQDAEVVLRVWRWTFGGRQFGCGLSRRLGYEQKMNIRRGRCK
jgi:hypothetical protein